MHASPAARANFPAAILGYAAAGAAVTALLGAALNLLEFAAYLLVGSIACFTLRLLLFLYIRLPDADRNKVVSRQVIRRTVAVSSVLAVAVSCAYWYGTWWLPLDDMPPEMLQLLARHWRKADFVPALFAQLLPTSWESGFHQYFRGGWTYCFPGPYWWESMRYLRAAIPGYFVAFFVTFLLVRLVAVSVRHVRR